MTLPQSAPGTTSGSQTPVQLPNFLFTETLSKTSLGEGLIVEEQFMVMINEQS